MSENLYEFKIIKDHDVEVCKKDFDKLNKIKLDLRNNKLSIIKFEELFERLSITRIEIFELDLSYTECSSSALECINKCLRFWNLKTLILKIVGIKISDSDFDSLIYESLKLMSNMTNLYLDLESLNKWTHNKSRSMNKLFSKLQLEKIYINLKNASCNKEDMEEISKSIKHISTKELIF